MRGIVVALTVGLGASAAMGTWVGLSLTRIVIFGRRLWRVRVLGGVAGAG